MCRPHTHQARTCVCTHYDTCVCFTRIMHAISWWQIFQRICVRVRSSRSSAQKSADCHASTPLPPPPPPALPPFQLCLENWAAVTSQARPNWAECRTAGARARATTESRMESFGSPVTSSVITRSPFSQHALSLQSAPCPSTQNPKCADSRYTFSV